MKYSNQIKLTSVACAVQHVLRIAAMSLTYLLITFYAQAVHAASNQAGEVIFVNGRVTATTPKNEVRVLSKSDDIFMEDRIDTAENGRVQVRFTDGGLVSLMPETVFSVEEYFHDDTNSSDSAVFGLLKGGFRTVTGSIEIGRAHV